MRWWDRGAHQIRRSVAFAERAQAETSESFDLVIAHDVWSLWAIHRLIGRSKTPLVLDLVEFPRLRQRSGRHIRSTPLQTRLVVDGMTQWFMLRSAAVVTVSPSLGAALRRRTRRPVILLRNFRLADTATDREPRRLRRHLGLAPGSQVVAFINAIGESYGAEELVGALQHLDQSVHVALVGNFTPPEMRDRIETQATRLGVRHRVHIVTDPVPYDEFPSWIADADVGVVGTTSSVANMRLAMPNRVTDFVAAGVPILTGGMPDVAALVEAQGIGAVIPEWTAELVASGVRGLLVPGKAAAVERALAEAQRTLTWEREAELFLNTCDALVQRAQRSGQGRVAIVARKDVSRNGRIRRMAASLSERGHVVTVVAESGKVDMAATLVTTGGPQWSRPSTIPDGS